VSVTPHERRKTVARAEVLEKIRGRHISTFQLIGDDEYAAGLERAERELSDEVEATYGWLVAVASV
jgi:hypothetical protein